MGFQGLSPLIPMATKKAQELCHPGFPVEETEVLRVEQKSQGAALSCLPMFLTSRVVNTALFIPVVTFMSFCLFCYISWKFLDYLHEI